MTTINRYNNKGKYTNVLYSSIRDGSNRTLSVTVYDDALDIYEGGYDSTFKLGTLDSELISDPQLSKLKTGMERDFFGNSKDLKYFTMDFYY